MTSPSSLELLGSSRRRRALGQRLPPFQLRDAEAVLDASGPPFTFITRPRGGRESTDAAGYAVALHLTAAPSGGEELCRSRPTPNRLAWSSTPSAASCAERPSSVRASRSRLAGSCSCRGARPSAAANFAGRRGQQLRLAPLAVICDELLLAQLGQRTRPVVHGGLGHAQGPSLAADRAHVGGIARPLVGWCPRACRGLHRSGRSTRLPARSRGCPRRSSTSSAACSRRRCTPGCTKTAGLRERTG